MVHNSLLLNQSNLLRRDQGFTLIEVLVALVIIAAALSAAYFALIQSTKTMSSLDGEMKSHLVAMEQLQNYQINLEKNAPKFNGIKQSTARFNRTWSYMLTSENITPHIVKINIVVEQQGNHQIKASLFGFIYDNSN